MTQSDNTAEEREQYHSFIKAGSTRLLNTITNYMDVSMVTTGNMEVRRKHFNLHPVFHSIEEQFQPICAEKHLELHLKIPGETKSLILCTDYELFRKVVLHLLDNAVKFTHQGAITLGYTIKSGSVEVFVQDTGAGISKEAQQRIFEHFSQEELMLTRGYEGSGLGLSIARGIVKLLGGEIRVESQKGTGSTFFFTIPVEEPSIGIPASEGAETEIPVIEKPVILVAEDDESNYLYLETILEKNSVTVLSASNGKEAVDNCRDHPEISLVLMDMKMPVMDGSEATREIKSFRKKLPIIAVTAAAMIGDEKRALEAGCDDYLSKPVGKDTLLKKLQRYGIGS